MGTGLQELATLPSCAQTCFEASCSLADLACICGAEAQRALDHCLRLSCPVPEGYYARRLAGVACQFPVRDHGPKLNIIVYVLGFTTGFCIVTRVLFKQFWSSKQRLDNDDWTILSAIPTGAVLMAVVVFGLSRYGLGVDLWEVPSEDVRIFGIFFFIVSVMYLVIMTQIKLSLCFFYLNIFPGRTVRILLWATVYFHVVTAATFIVAVVLSCNPIQYQWERYNLDVRPPAQGKCVNINAAGWAHSAINVASDLWLFAMPLIQVRKLKLHIKKKIGIALMFLTGATVTVISILRLRSVETYTNTTNPTWDQWDIVWWSTLEITSGFICTSLPTLRLILIRIAPRTFDTDRLRGDQPIQISKPKTRASPLCSGHTLPTLLDLRDQKSSVQSVARAQSQTALCENGEPIAGRESPV
ncbi:hypothetical protein EsDP_00004063 [Epichloe bromicola]|uniref:Extracellular membrane protein CFEM domain-containing protein n=1 Tax=Epichloe bromicola TaxID=79588 RepID=A0ABQ0CQL5_9HYPO